MFDYIEIGPHRQRRHVSLGMLTPIQFDVQTPIGDRPVTGPMLRLFSDDERFLLLALSQRDLRLMEGSRTTVEPVHLSETTTSLRDVVDPQEPRSNTMARSADRSGRGGPAPLP